MLDQNLKKLENILRDRLSDAILKKHRALDDYYRSQREGASYQTLSEKMKHCEFHQYEAKLICETLTDIYMLQIGAK